MRKLLELINEFVNDVPQPEIRQLQSYGFVLRLKHHIKESAVVVVRLKSLIQVRALGNRCINMSIVKFPVQHQEHLNRRKFT